jgi:hypothetical protein
MGDWSKGFSTGRAVNTWVSLSTMLSYDVQRHCVVKKHSGHRENHSGGWAKTFAFPPESLFAFSPESCSSSPRNRFRVHPGILFAFARNPQQV